MANFCPHCRASLPTQLPRVCPFCARETAAQAAAPGPSAVGHALLMARLPDGAIREHRIGGVTRIGRAPTNPVQLADPEVSKEHAEIRPVGADWWIEDLGSSNGTFVNGRRVTRFKLRDADELILGATHLVFRCAGSPARAGPAVSMVHSIAPRVLASVVAEDADTSQAGFRPEWEIANVADLRRDYEKLRIANELHRQVGLERDLTALCERILEVAFDLLPADNGVILVPDPEGGALSPAAVRRRKGGEVELSQTLLDQVVQSRAGVLTQDAIVDARFSAAASIVAQGIRSAMAVPLLSKGELRGVLYLDTRERTGAFTEKDLRVLSGIATQAAVAIENADLARRIEQEAETRAHLSRFLSPALVEQAQSGQLELTKGGELCEITVLFADIRGFTSMTERAPPQEIVALLNDHFEQMVDVVFACGGVLDKFIGDCIMALWGAPVRREDDAERALRAAVAMQQRLRRSNEDRAAAGLEPVAMGVGVNTGPAVVGNIGSSKRLEYTAIGDAVNLASRLCSLAGRGQVLASTATVARAGDTFRVRPLPAATIKGKAEPVAVYEVLGPRERATDDTDPLRR